MKRMSMGFVVAALSIALQISAAWAVGNRDGSDLLKLMNDFRPGAWTMDGEATRMAQSHSREMCTQGRLSTERFRERLLQFGLGNVAAAEINASTWDYQPQQAFALWKQDAAAGAQMASPRYNRIGIGIWDCADGQTYYSVVFARR
jgi:uncharacterized protein YkwD